MSFSQKGIVPKTQMFPLDLLFSHPENRIESDVVTCELIISTSLIYIYPVKMFQADDRCIYFDLSQIDLH